MKSLFEKETVAEIKKRILQLDSKCQPVWGKMTVDQMLVHCQKPLELALRKITIPKGKLIFRLLAPFFKSSMYNDTPWKQNQPTIPAFKITSRFDVSEEQKKLLDLMQEFHQTIPENLGKHPFFGSFTSAQWGQLQYKHLDHHLRQFGV